MDFRIKWRLAAWNSSIVQVCELLLEKVYRFKMKGSKARHCGILLSSSTAQANTWAEVIWIFSLWHQIIPCSDRVKFGLSFECLMGRNYDWTVVDGIVRRKSTEWPCSGWMFAILYKQKFTPISYSLWSYLTWKNDCIWWLHGMFGNHFRCQDWDWALGSLYPILVSKPKSL